MACSDAMPSNWGAQEAIQRERDSRLELQKKYDLVTQEMSKTTNYLSACLCALLTEISKHPVGDHFINDAEENGSVDIRSFWDNHRSQDIERLEKSIKANYSSHELQLLKELFENLEIV